VRIIHGLPPAVRRAWAAALVLPFVLGTALLAAAPGAATATDSLGPMHAAGIGLDNFGIVDGRIYRGAQPGRDDYRALAALGVTVIIDLRLDSKSSSRGYAEAAGLTYVNIAIDDHGQPTDLDVVAFLKALDENPTTKIYVHCAGGRHRTGSMIAVYRMVRDGWTLERAYQEMLAYDFYTRSGHEGFKSFVDRYWQRMNANPASVPAAAVQVSK
jgi:protein tyrosine/serine phosphatase